jgi:hypothetical protein
VTAFSNFRRFAGALAGLAGGLVGLGGVAAAQPQSVSPSEAPAEWVRYAEVTTQTITRWLAEDNEAATALRAYLHQTRAVDNQPAPPLVLKIWMKPEGQIDRIGFTPFAHETANADLRTVIVGRTLEAPPRDMLLPLRLAIQFDSVDDGEDQSTIVTPKADSTLH